MLLHQALHLKELESVSLNRSAAWTDSILSTPRLGANCLESPVIAADGTIELYAPQTLNSKYAGLKLNVHSFELSL